MTAASPHKHRKVTLLVCVAGAVFAVGPASSASSCGPPELVVEKTELRQTDRIEVAGHTWQIGCPEAGASGGCGGDKSSEQSIEPVEDIEVSLVPRNDADPAIVLGTVDARDNEDHSFVFRKELVDVPPGKYEVHASSGDIESDNTVPITIER